MEFFNSLLSALGKLVLHVGIWVTLALNFFAAGITVQTTPAPSPLLTVKITESAISTTTAATTTKKAATAPSPAQKAAVVVSSTTINVPAAPAPPPVAITDDLIAQTNTQTRESLVNILCSFRTAHTSSYISGSGLIIDPRGVILTNAHVAQFFLLQNQPGADTSSCTIRIGSPAIATYNAALLYLPPLWVASNASQILSEHAAGTGERDYAFLYITGAAPFAPPLPSSFPALTPSFDNPSQSTPVLLAAYPAGFLDANGVQRNLYISSAVSTIGQLYTFDSPTDTDLVSLGGTVVSQSGSSGGAVINLTDGKLVGLISSESEGTTTSSRDLRAITLGYINRNLAVDGKGGLSSLLEESPLKTSQDFNTNIAPALVKDLLAVIDAQP